MTTKQLTEHAVGRSKSLAVFAGDMIEPYDTLIRRAQERIHEIKDTYQGQTMSFEYLDEVVTGRFIDAVEGDYPGTYMIVLRVPSSRLFIGPCFVHMNDERFGGIIVSDDQGLAGITVKALPERRFLAIPLDADLACFA
ncbi:MAG TPA: hypothetical protein VMP11_20420 [Verrucomicrobiae bacterium]|nr:hypothetical protein [Verrucomicrobiae bacterium]